MGRLRRQGARLMIAKRFLFGACTVAALLGAAVFAQESPVFRVETRLVRLLVTVKDRAGDLKTDLTQRDFAVSDNNVSQELALFERQSPQPMSVALLIDTSASTARNLKYEATSINTFLKALVGDGNPDDSAALYSFNYQVTLHNSFTRRVARLEDSLKNLKAEAGTAFYDAVYLASRDLEKRDGRHVIVVVTDGNDTNSVKSFVDADRAAHRSDSVIYSIVVVPISNPAGRALSGEHALETLATNTGGRAFHATVGVELDRVFADILRDLRRQYLLGYYPKGVRSGDGTFHAVRVTLPERKDLRISTRTGYYSDR
ncbi:MAG: VWA domain-containing protein [Bryobacteraceae bacterium]